MNLPEMNKEETQIYPTLVRVKRKLNEEQVELLLVNDPVKKQRLHHAKVFTRITTLSDGAASVTAVELDSYQQVLDHVKEQRTILRANPKQSSQPEKQVLSSKKLKQAQDARYKIVTDRRLIAMQKDGFHLVEVEREEKVDPLTSGLESMALDYIEESGLEKRTEQVHGFVYDWYMHDDRLPISQALNRDRIGTLEMKDEDIMYMNDEATDSDKGSSSDSNAEDYYANDYPEEEDDEEEQARRVALRFGETTSEDESSFDEVDSSDY